VRPRTTLPVGRPQNTRARGPRHGGHPQGPLEGEADANPSDVGRLEQHEGGVHLQDAGGQAESGSDQLRQLPGLGYVIVFHLSGAMGRSRNHSPLAHAHHAG
jgi:hypothetical protein